jgi:UDP-GlcNAc:undecaprenyl-phosphate GlcNAc-1-phosphate transferase
MINALLNQIHLLSLFVSIVIMVVLNTLFSFFWPQIQAKTTLLKPYNAVQKVHDGEVARLGGLVSYVGLMAYWLLSHNGISMPFIEAILLSSIPLLLIGVKEDLFHNTSATQRLLGMLLTTLLFFNLYPVTYPVIEFPIIGELIDQIPALSLIFFIFATLVIMNGNNLIDGANGLMSMSIFMQVMSLFFLAYEVDDFDMQVNLLYLVIPLMIFLLFNYPWGKIFMGDFGAYFYGLMISTITIIFFGEHPELPTWGAVLILFYPAFELLFSVIRKTMLGQDPTQPDPNHLHLKIYFLLRDQVIRPRVSNGLVMPCLSLVWGMPFFLIVWTFNSMALTIIGIFFITLIYCGFFWALPKKNN